MNLIIHIDGGARGNPGPAAAAVVLREGEPTGSVLHEAAYYIGNASNNVAEYTALVRALELAVAVKAQEVQLHSDSELMVRQITGQYRVRSPDLLPLFERAQGLLLKFDSWQIKHIYREANRRADELVNLALDAGKNVVVKSIVPGQAASTTAGVVSPPPSVMVAAPPLEKDRGFGRRTGRQGRRPTLDGHAGERSGRQMSGEMPTRPTISIRARHAAGAVHLCSPGCAGGNLAG